MYFLKFEVYLPVAYSVLCKILGVFYLLFTVHCKIWGVVHAMYPFTIWDVLICSVLCKIWGVLPVAYCEKYEGFFFYLKCNPRFEVFFLPVFLTLSLLLDLRNFCLLPVVEQPLQQVGHWQDKLATIILQLRLFLHFLQQSVKEFDHFIF